MCVNRIWLMLAITTLISLTAGCSATSNTTPQVATGQPVDTAPTNSSYPAPGQYNPYPAQEQTTTPSGRAPEPIPAPSADAGVVHGTLYDIKTDQPIYDGVIVYLSQIIPTQNTDMEAVTLDRDNDPSTTPDVQGGFAFANVPPGRYGIVVKGPIQEYLTRESADQTKNVLVTVEAGKTIDVGKIYTGYP